MGFFSLRRWLNRKSRSSRNSPSSRSRLRSRTPVLERLEDRLAPATDIWTGAGNNLNWSNSANWTLGTPNPGDDLVFGPGVSAARMSTNNDIGGGFFNSITISAGGYTLAGKQITLGGASGGNSFIVNSSCPNNKVSLDIQLGGGAGQRQFFTINFASDLTLAGHLKGTTGVNLTKEGTGLLVFQNDNSTFTGPITVDQGILQITNANALGTTSAGATVHTNAQLQVNGVTGTILEPLFLNGPGVKNDGAILNVAGNNTWAGTVELDADSTFGSNAGSLNFTNTISDLGAGHSLTKEGVGQFIFSHANTYRGLTTINNGVLTIRDPKALGAGGTAQNGTLVNATFSAAGALLEAGTLQLEDPTGVGFTVQNELLTLNGPGATVNGTAIGALDNLNGNNSWEANVTLGSPSPNGSDVSIGSEVQGTTVTNLTIDGVVGNASDGGVYKLNKVGPGRVILTASNTYLGNTDVQVGMLQIDDSQGLGPAGKGGGTVVEFGAALELAVDSKADSVTGTTNTLYVNEPLTINGEGVSDQGGALRNVSGINVYAATISLGQFAKTDAIGVDPDPNPKSDNSYFPTYGKNGVALTGDYSLTVIGNISGTLETAFEKLGTGQLILPNPNTYLGPTLISQGWVTVRDNQALGAHVPGLGDTVQPLVHVQPNAALHLKPLTPTGVLNFPKNLILAGNGISHPFGLINQKGALMNLGGFNTESGDVKLDGQAGIGVEQVDPASPSELTMTGSVSRFTPPTLSFSTSASGGSQEARTDYDTGSTSGTMVINYDMFVVPDDLRVYYQGQRIFDTGVVSGTGTINLAWGPGSSTIVTIVMNEGGGQAGTVWTYSVVFSPAPTGGGGITKFGSKRLNLQGDGTYSGNVDIKEGVLRAQNDTALGNGSGTTIVEPGAALEMMGGIPQNNGGVNAGIQPWGETLLLNGPGNLSENGTLIAPLTSVSDDNMWRGPVTLNTPFTVSLQNTLATSNPPLMLVDGSGLTGTKPSVTVVPAGVVGSSTANVIQAISFGGSVTGGTFTLSFNGSTTGPIAWDPNAPTLVANLEAALNQLSTIGNNALVNVSSPMVAVAQDSRLSLFGTIDDAPNPSINGTDLIKVGSGELALIGSNTYRGTTYVNQGTLIVQNGQGLGVPGTPDVQTITVIGSTGTFTLTWGGQTTPALPVNATAAQVQAALNALSSISGSTGGSVSVTLNNNVYTVSFLGALGGFSQPLLTASGSSGAAVLTAKVTDGGGGTVVAGGASLDLQGNITVAGEQLQLQGQGVTNAPNVPLRWFQQGPKPILAGQTAGNGNVTGRVTGVAGDPTDPNVIYISTAGGGAWKTKDGGQSWLPLFDQQNPITPIPIFTGSIAVAPSDPRIIYLGTGEADNSGDSYYGSGVYRSSDSGHTWTQLVDVTGNPLNGLAVSKVVVDPSKPNLIYVATSDQAVGSPLGNVGVWRYDGKNWFNMTANTPLQFPSQDATWSDLVLNHDVLIAALGTAQDLTGLDADDLNAVYNTSNPSAPVPTWSIGDFPKAADGGGSDPISAETHASTIKLAAAGTTVYAAVTEGATGALLQIYKSTNQGANWSKVSKLPANYMGDQGDYDSAIAAASDNVVYVGGQEADPSTHLQQVFVSKDGGGTWSDISVDFNGNGPHTDHHGMAIDAKGRLIDGNDGGVWLYDPTASTPVWSDLNGNLAITTLNGITTHPSNLNVAFGASQDNGTEMFSGNQGWTFVDFGDGGIVEIDQQNPNIVYHVSNGSLLKSTTGGGLGSFTDVLDVGPLYFPFILDRVNDNRLVVGGPSVQETVDGAATWSDLIDTFNNLPIFVTTLATATYQGNFQSDPAFKLVTDQGANTYDPGTIYAWDANFNRLLLTKNHGVTWVDRTGNLDGRTIQNIAVDPRTRDIAYAVASDPPGTGKGRVFMTTNAGQDGWIDITGNLPDVPTYKVVVDPRNGNLYVGNDDGVYVSTDAGADWQRFGAGLPFVQATNLDLNLSANTLAVGSYGRSMFQVWLDDAQSNAGALRSLSGSGVWTGPVVLAGPTTISAGGTQVIQNGVATATLNIVGSISDLTDNAGFQLTKIGAGDVILSGGNIYTGPTVIQEGALVADNAMALGSTASPTYVQPTDPVHFPAALEVESSILGEPLFLSGDGIPFNGHFRGALDSVSNNNVYSGPITLLTNSTIGVESGSILAITNTIDDNFSNLNLTKESTGTLILAHANTYSGTTFVNQGALQITDPQALGTPQNGTQVMDGAQLQIQGAPAQAIAVTGKNGTYTLTFNGQTTGSLPFNASAAQIQSALNALSTIGGVGGSVTVTQSGNVYTVVFQGILGGLPLPLLTPATTGGLVVAVNAVFGAPVVVNGEPLTLSGTGIFGTGALLNTGGNNTWEEPSNQPIILTSIPGFSPPTTPPANVAFGVANLGDTLTIAGPIAETAANNINDFGVTKVGPGTMVLQEADTYTGLTTVAGGVVTIQNNQALGGQAISEVQQVQLTGKLGGTFTLTFNGQTTTPIPFNDNGSQMQAALNALLSIGGLGGSVTVTAIGSTYLVTFQGSLDGFPQSLLVGTTTNLNMQIVVTEVTAGNGGTVVNNGAALQLDLLNSPSQTVSGEPLMLNGTGINGTGALDNLSGNNTWTGAQILLATSSAIGVDGGSLTASGNVAGPGGASLSKVGVGTLFFPTANNYQGDTLVQNGILSISNSGALGSPGASAIQTVTVTGTAGTFNLTFNGQTTTDLAYNATAAQVQSALNALSSIGGVNGSVTVMQVNGVYTVTFGGSFTGLNQPALIASASGGDNAVVNVLVAGSDGTIVSAGATLQMQADTSGNGIVVSNEPLTLTGAGLKGIGALDSSSGVNTYDSPITLAGSSSIAADTDPILGVSVLTIDQAISESVKGSNLTKLGTGALVLSGATANTYTGTTQVNDGLVQLNKAGVLAVPGNLVIGDGTAGNPGTDIVQLLAGNQIAATANVTINTDGLFDLGSQTQTINNLTMTGGTVSLTGAPSQLTLTGNVTAASDTGKLPAAISGAGALVLTPSGKATTFTVNAGKGPVDLAISTPILGGSTVGLTKAGGGVLKLTGAASYGGLTTGTAGTLLVDQPGSVGNVSVTGGTLGGTGTVGTGSASVAAIAATSGTVHPGDGPGILSATGDVNLSAKTNFDVSINGTSAGVGYSQLVVNGNVDLAGATLTGVLGNGFQPSVNVDTFTIIRVTGTGHTIKHQFTQGTSVFLGGDKFSVAYNPTTVVLIRVPTTTTTAVAVAPTSGVPNTVYTVTATITSEVPGGSTPGTVDFTVTGPNSFSQTFSGVPVTNNMASVTLQGLAVGTYTVTSAQYTSSDTGIGASSAQTTPTFTVGQDSTTTAVPSANPTSLTYGQGVAFQTTVTPGTQGGVTGNLLPGGTVTFKDGSTTLSGGTVSVIPNGTVVNASVNVSLLGAGTHQINAAYSGDSNYKSSSSASLTYVVGKAGSTITVASTNSNAVYGTATITASVAPQFAGQPTGTVTFSINNGAITETDSLLSGVATLQQTLGTGSYTITASYSGDNNFLSNAISNSLGQTVTPATSSTAVASSATNNTSVYGQAVTFTATVTGSAGLALPAGTVTFFLDGVKQVPNVTVAGGQATLTTSALTVNGSPHSVSATFNPVTNGNYQTSSGSLTGGQTVTPDGTSSVLVSSDNPSVVDETVTYTDTVSAAQPGSGTVQGTVKFFDGSVQIGSTQTLNTVSGQQQAAIQVTYFLASSTAHQITAVYQGDDPSGNFQGGTSNQVNQLVNPAATTTTVGSSSAQNTSTYGQQVTFTATISVNSPSTGTPTGSVTFYYDAQDNAHQLGTGTVGTVGSAQQATYTTTATQLPGGGHTIYAVFASNNSNIGGSTGTLTQTVNQAGTTTTDVSTDNPGAIYGQPITLTATVSATTSGIGVPTGTINLYDGAVNSADLIGSGTVDTGGKLALVFPNSSPVRAALAVGSHTITAVYQGDTNFASSTSPTPQFIQTVGTASTSTSVVTDTPNAVYGQETITATVTDTSPNSTGTPTGIVNFTITTGGTSQVVPVSLVNGVATLTSPTAVATALSATGHNPTSYTISAAYQGDNNFSTSTGSLSGTQNVSQANSSTLLTSSSTNNTSVFGQAVTFTAVVSPKAPGAGLPTGTVTFLNGSSPLGSAVTLQNVNGNMTASITVSNLSFGANQNITAQYSGDPNFIKGTSNTVQQTVNAAATATVLSASATQVAYGQPVTLTATVSVTGAGAGTPQGTVTFFNGNTALGQVTLQTVGNQQQASLTTQPSDLSIGPNQLKAVYADTVDSNFQGSTSNFKTVAVNPASTTTTLQSSRITPVVGHQVAFTATVSTTTTSLGTPAGNVLFTVDTTQAIVPLTNGQAVLTLTAGLALGNHTVTAAYQGSSNFSQSTSPTLTVTVLTPNQGYVAQVYRDLLGREVDPSGLAAWSSLLDRGILNRTQLAASIEASTEYRSDVVDALYVHYLHRHADPLGLNTFVSATAFGMTDEQVAASLAGSLEYFNNRGGGTVNGFLDALFQDTLNRAIDPTGRQAFTQALAFNVSRQQVAASVLGSPEYQTDLVTNYYNTYLHRGPDPNGLGAWVNALAHGLTDEAAIASIIGSDEYFNNL
jgi:autotransporter-associated beta strand protein